MPLTWVSLAFLIGILLSSGVSLPWVVWLLIAGGCIIGLLSLRGLSAKFPSNRILAVVNSGLARSSPFFFLAPGVLLVFLALGGARYAVSQPLLTPQSLAWYNGKNVTLDGWICFPPETVSSGTRLDISVDRIQTTASSTSGQSISGKVRVTIPPGRKWRYGERVRLSGDLNEPADYADFSYKDYLTRQGISSVMYYPNISAVTGQNGNFILAALYTLRERGGEVLAQIFPAPESSLIQGILLGDDSQIPSTIYQDFRDTGTSHIIAISGFNVAILSGLIASLMTRLLGKRKGSLAAIIGISLYTILVGASPSVVRACIMGGLGLLAAQIGRRQNGINTLAFTAAGMSLLNPYVVWDTGFQLSFAATLGLILYAAPLQEACVRWFSRFTGMKTASKAASLVGEYFLFTIAAQITTLPILILTFNRFSPITFLANPLVLPAQPLLMITAGAALLCGLVYLPLGQIIGLAAWPFAAYTIHIDEWFGPLARGSLFSRQISPIWAVLFYGLLAVFTLRFLREKIVPFLKPNLALLITGVAAICFWHLAVDRPDGRLNIWIFGDEDGKESAVLIQTPSGRSLLIGSLSSSPALNGFIGRQLPFGGSALDVVILPPSLSSQYAAVSDLLEQNRVNLLLWSGKISQSQAGSDALQTATDQGGEVVEVTPDRQLDLGSGALLTVQTAGESTLSTRLDWKDFSADIVSNGTQPPDPRGENGSPVWIQLKGTCPGPSGLDDSVFFAVCDNPPGDPTSKAVNHLAAREYRWVHLSTDGNQLWVETQKR